MAAATSVRTIGPVDAGASVVEFDVSVFMGKDYLPPTVDATARLKMRENVSMSTPVRSTSLTELLLLGQGRDLASERGVSCTGELPEASDPDLISRARIARSALGDRALVLGHHYQRDEVIEFADVTGDSFKLAQAAAAQSSAEYIIFCGVHFMAESADILTSNNQKVILPDLAAGCSMADMATANQVTQCWRDLEEVGVADKTIPVT